MKVYYSVYYGMFVTLCVLLIQCNACANKGNLLTYFITYLLMCTKNVIFLKLVIWGDVYSFVMCDLTSAPIKK